MSSHGSTLPAFGGGHGATDVADEGSPVRVGSGGNEGLPMWNNKKLYPPNKSRSLAWIFGGFLIEEGKLDMQKTICGLCGLRQKYCSTPTNLMQHVQNHHPNSIPKDFAMVKNAKKHLVSHTSTPTCPTIGSYVQ